MWTPGQEHFTQGCGLFKQAVSLYAVFLIQKHSFKGSDQRDLGGGSGIQQMLSSARSPYLLTFNGGQDAWRNRFLGFLNGYKNGLWIPGTVVVDIHLPLNFAAIL